jgi:hypothetical protein
MKLDTWSVGFQNWILVEIDRRRLMKLDIWSVNFQNLILIEIDRRRLMKLNIWSAEFQNLILLENIAAAGETFYECFCYCMGRCYSLL